MKYFIGNSKHKFDREPHEILLMTIEVSKDKARELYMIWGEHNGYSNDALEQLPLAFWKRGEIVSLRHYDIWGEDTSNSELFKRRLNGRLAKEVVK